MGKKFNYILSVLLVCITFFSSCKKDQCEQTITYTTFEPVYMTFDELRNAVKSEPAQSLHNPGKIYIKGNYIFVNEIDKGIHIIDNSNPASPQNIAFINIPGNADIAATGSTLYADSYVDLLAIDISNPLSISVVQRMENALPNQKDVSGYYTDPEKGVVVDWLEKEVTEKVNTDCKANGGGYWGGPWLEDGGIVTLNNAGGGFVKTSGSSGIGGSMARFTIANNMLYVVDQSSLRIFNINGGITSMGTSYIGRNIETIFAYNNHLFIGSTNGMFIYNISNPTNPSYVSTYIHGTACDPVVADDNYAYITLRSGTPCNTTFNQLEVVNIQNITSPILSHTVSLTNPHGLGKDNNTLFICDGAAGLKVFDATNPEQISENPVSVFSTIQATDVIPFNNKLLMIGEDGLYQYDYSNVNDIHLISRIAVTK